MKTWNSDTIDLFHSVKRRAEYVMNGIGSVRERTASDKIDAVICVNVNNGTVRVTDWNGNLLYFANKD